MRFLRYLVLLKNLWLFLRGKHLLFSEYVRESTYNFIYRLNLLIALTSWFLFVIYQGYNLSEDVKESLLFFFKVCGYFYIIQYIVRIIVSRDWLKVLLSNRVEGVLILLLLFSQLALVYFEKQGGIAWEVALFLYQGYYVLFSLIEASTMMPSFIRINISPGFLFFISLVIYSLLGWILLLMPQMSTGLGVLDALFISVSAVCVTGLSPIEITHYLTYKGLFVLMILMQLGGATTITYGIFFMLTKNLISKGWAFFPSEWIIGASSSVLLTRIFIKSVFFYFILEGIGTLLIYLSWFKEIEFNGIFEKIFHSLFLVVAAVNNAGFSSVPFGFLNDYLVSNYIMQAITIVLVFCGGLGLPHIFDFINPENIRRFLFTGKMRIRVSTKIVLITSLTLLLIGGLATYLLHHELRDEGLLPAIVKSLFISQMTRTCGFSNIDLSKITSPLLIIYIMLMIIGGSPAGTAGGIKTTSLFILIKMAIDTLRSKPYITVFKKRIQEITIFRVLTLISFYFIILFTIYFSLIIVEQDKIAMKAFTELDFFFECVSAISTVGLTTGVTPSLSPLGKIIIIIAMLIGRSGVVTIGYLFISPKEKIVKYPKEEIPL